MSEVIRVLVVIAVIGYVIGRQLLGEPLRGKRVVVLPVILAVAGAADLGKNGRHVEPADVICLVISGLIAVTIGLLQGRMIRLEARNGALWADAGARPVAVGAAGRIAAHHDGHRARRRREGRRVERADHHAARGSTGSARRPSSCGMPWAMGIPFAPE